MNISQERDVVAPQAQQQLTTKFAQEGRDTTAGHNICTSCRDGCCFGTGAVAAAWRAERIPAIPVLTKTKSRLYCEYQQGIQLSPSQAFKPHPRVSTTSGASTCKTSSNAFVCFYTEYSVITRLTLRISSTIFILGGL